jgi:L-asparaginase
MLKKLLIVYAGGTIGMNQTTIGLVPCQNFSNILKDKINKSNYKKLVEFEIIPLSPLLDSANSCHIQWKQIAGVLFNNYDNYDGFIVLHGTDTMSYTASMLSFMLRPLSKPIIFTGAQLPVNNTKTDGWRNIFGSIACASNKVIKEVCLFFDGCLFRANRTTKTDTLGYRAFSSPNFPILGTYKDNQIILNSNYLLNNKPYAFATPDEIFDLFCSKHKLVHIVYIYPGIDEVSINQALESNVKAVIFLTLGSGNIPQFSKTLLKKIANLTKSNRIIINISQCFRGKTDQSIYGVSSSLVDSGILDMADITVESAFCKLHYLYSRYNDLTEIKKFIKTPIAGEFSID